MGHRWGKSASSRRGRASSCSSDWQKWYDCGAGRADYGDCVGEAGPAAVRYRRIASGRGKSSANVRYHYRETPRLAGRRAGPRGDYALGGLRLRRRASANGRKIRPRGNGPVATCPHCKGAKDGCSCCCSHGGSRSHDDPCQCSASKSAPGSAPVPGSPRSGDTKSLSTPSLGGLASAAILAAPRTSPMPITNRAVLAQARLSD